MLILAHIYKVDKCGSFDYVATQVPFVWVKTILGYLTLAWHVLSSRLRLAVALGAVYSAFAGVWDRMQDLAQDAL